jgi:hypothetical protein
MKITKLSTYRLAPRWMFLKIETDEGREWLGRAGHRGPGQNSAGGG